MEIFQSQYENTSSGSWKIRRVTGWLLLAGLILSSAYAAGLSATFTVPRYEASIDTVQDIVDRDMEWGATHDAWIFSLTLSTEVSVENVLYYYLFLPTYLKFWILKLGFVKKSLPILNPYICFQPLVKQLVGQFRIYSFDKLKEKSFTRSMAYSIEKLPAGR